MSKPSKRARDESDVSDSEDSEPGLTKRQKLSQDESDSESDGSDGSYQDLPSTGVHAEAKSEDSDNESGSGSDSGSDSDSDTAAAPSSTSTQSAAAANRSRSRSSSSESSGAPDSPKAQKSAKSSTSSGKSEADADAPLAGQLKIDDSTTFEQLGVDPALCDACRALNYKHPSDIQKEALPWALKGRDIIGLAETGSGKTASFALPILQALLDKPQPFYGLVLAPTRELAYQISEQFHALGSEIGVKCTVLVGGMDMTAQAIQLAGKPHVVVATPGRIIDHLENTKGFSLRNLKCLVFDEADRLLNMDFEKELNALLRVIPRDRRTYLYSATMTRKVEKLQRASLRNPVKVEVSRRYQTVSTLKQEFTFIPAKFKDIYLAAMLNDMIGKTMMIFVNTIRAAQRVALMLRALGFSAVPLHGKMPQSKRLGSLNKFKSGSRGILVATDVASRGLDIPAVDVVVNYDVPTKSKDYIHRVGRTARAGRSGRAVSLVTQYDVELFQRIEKLIGIKMTEYPAEQDAVMLLQERVAEAQRLAVMDMKEQEVARQQYRAEQREKTSGGAGGGKKRGFKKGGGGGGGGGGKSKRRMYKRR